ncbi:MAG: glutamine--fructose-6-phosphate transaminase (isomerizing), partial [Gammaproteobacteria bacterium]|nr:glutamine--fructose-6-phosphate transaminase (isomerizing) [Gammaproteobacteria bacterium]
MCGIVGYVGRADAVPILLDGLKQLEYRGYDSAGVAVQQGRGLTVVKRAGRLDALHNALPRRFKGRAGIGHTRWATHGAPNDINAHPHADASGKLVIVHNGIIENVAALRDGLVERGLSFVSETDTEVLANLIAVAHAHCADLAEATRLALRQTTGAYGIAVMHRDHPDEIVVARNGSPVILGVSDHEMLVASDAAALVRYTQRVVYLRDGEIARVRADGYQVVDLDAAPAEQTPTELVLDVSELDLGGYAHHTRKEIEEQPEVVTRTMSGRLDRRFQTAHLGGLNLDPRALKSFRRIKVLGCGSACFAGSLGARMIESLARIPCEAEPAAEFRYRNPIIEDDTLYFAVSQSGETADTLMAVQEITRKGGTVLGVVNVVGSSIARACQGGVYLHAGPEVAVVSTKTFTATLVVFALLALHLARMRDASPADGERLIAALDELPDTISAVLEQAEAIAESARYLAGYENACFVGRGFGYPLAMEGALK